MVSIPQISRDRLASSVVGTPALDTSGQKIGESLAGAGKEVASAIGEYAVNVQENHDLAESNHLMVQKKAADASDFEELKETYAGDPDKLLPAYLESMKNNQAKIGEQASNPRVGLMFGRGDPGFEGWMVKTAAQWAFQQKIQVDKARVEAGINGLGDQAEALGSGKEPFIAKMDMMKVALHSQAGNLIAGASASAKPAAAEMVKERLSPTIFSRGFYGMLRDNPVQAVQLTKDPDVQKAFESNSKELDEMQQKAMTRVEGMAKQAKWNNMIQPLMDSPQIMNQIATKEVDWNTLEKFPEGELKQQLQKMALDSYPVENGQQRDQAMSKFFADAADIGMNYKHVPSDKTASDLVKFNTELTKAANDGFLTAEQYRTMVGKLSVPLRDAMLKLHDPDQLAKKKQEGGFMGMFTHDAPPDQAVDNYVGGYNVINKWLAQNGKGEDWEAKSASVQKYIENMDAAKPEDRDSLGRPNNPQILAQKALGIAVGDTLQTPFGPKKISGHDSEGMPKYEVSKEEQDILSHAKALKALRGK